MTADGAWRLSFGLPGGERREAALPRRADAEAAAEQLPPGYEAEVRPPDVITVPRDAAARGPAGVAEWAVGPGLGAGRSGLPTGYAAAQDPATMGIVLRRER